MLSRKEEACRAAPAALLDHDYSDGSDFDQRDKRELLQEEVEYDVLVVGAATRLSPLAGFVSGIPPAEFAVTPALPPGLTLDAATGEVSGAPLEAAGSCVYTVSAKNPGGGCAAQVAFEVQWHRGPSEPEYPPSLHGGGVHVFVCGNKLPEVKPAVEGTFLAFTVTPQLPCGIRFDPGTGRIHGTPEQETGPARYTVTVQNRVKKCSCTIEFEVQHHDSPSDLHYPFFASVPGGSFVVEEAEVSGGRNLAPTTIVVCGASLGPLTPQVKGNYLHFSVKPPLPEGLVFDEASGVVSGSPVVDTGAVQYVVAAKNEVCPHPLIALSGPPLYLLAVSSWHRAPALSICIF